jgi:chromosome partitioning protein
MMKVIALSNQKGGVGKTTSAVNIAAALSRNGQRVVLLDLDPQCNLTQGLGLGEALHNVYGALLGEYRLKVYAAGPDNLAVITGSAALSAFEHIKRDEPRREFLLRELLVPLQERCDFLIVDCPPALGMITLSAYTCADEVYIPVEAQQYAVAGLEKVLEFVARMQKRLNPKLKIGGIFFTRFDKRKILRRQTAELVRNQHPTLLLNTAIRESIALSEAPHAGLDIFSYAPQSAGASDYQALVAEILSR